MKRFISTLLFLISMSVTLIANANFFPLGFFALKKDYAIDDNPLIANHMVAYTNQSADQYTIFNVVYSYDFQFDYNTMIGKFTVAIFRIDSNTGRTLGNKAIMTTYRIAPKRSFSYIPVNHMICDVVANKVLLNKQAPMGSEILYKDSAAQLAGFKLTNRTDSSTYYPNR